MGISIKEEIATEYAEIKRKMLVNEIGKAIEKEERTYTIILQKAGEDQSTHKNLRRFTTIRLQQIKEVKEKVNHCQKPEVILDLICEMGEFVNRELRILIENSRSYPSGSDGLQREIEEAQAKHCAIQDLKLAIEEVLK